MGGNSIPLAVLWGRQGFGCNFDRTLREVSYKWYNSHQSLSQLGWVPWSSPVQLAHQGLCPLHPHPGLFAFLSAGEYSVPLTQNLLSILAAGFPFRNHLSRSVSENHNQGKFLIWTVRHTHKNPKNDLEKNPPNSIRLPHSDKWKEGWPLPVLDNTAMWYFQRYLGNIYHIYSMWGISSGAVLISCNLLTNAHVS